MFVDYFPPGGVGCPGRCLPVLATDQHNHLLKVEFKEGGSSGWCHSDDCEAVSECFINNRPSDLKNIALHLESINSLSKEGVYCYSSGLWRRLFLTNHSRIGIRLVEDGKLAFFMPHASNDIFSP